MPVKCCNLTDKVAIVTGASRGIGEAIAKQLSSCGAKIILIARNSDQLVAVKETIISNGGIAESMAGDVSNLNSISEIVTNTIDKWGRIDILVNNAGIARDNIIMRMKEDDWDSVMNINLKGCFNGIKSVARPMIKNKAGRIINITSVIGQIGNAGQSNYAASKAGIMGLTKSMAKELGSRNITVNAVAPGYITTDMTNELNDEVKEQLKSSIPLGRLGTPDDVANLVCFLASDEAGYITGQTFNVDGGMVMI
ncbi:MAG: 3-oxoacyl-[acyl-carrier-protein] reductase [Candidatus Marinimicrobia bacterium]|jgi:3-oxoacyl-[acyl-carrier protein] reductase|nr:3-oxoacyl-[acyl-carrier-protein] reductase [Candidatus Neomarinimicrobiota bacterium]